MTKIGQSRSMTFNLLTSNSLPRFGPRLGRATIKRLGALETSDTNIDIDTPGLIASSSRGIIPHLSRDHVKSTGAITWVGIPFETFLEHMPPVPTLQGGSNPLHRLLGYERDRNVLLMSLRDPADGREMPPNGTKRVSAFCIRGVRKVSPSDYRSYVVACNPDVTVALSDTPFTPAPHSQKRLTKSIERSLEWLADLLQPLPYVGDSPPSANSVAPHPLNILVPMAGGTSVAARAAFAAGLVEVLYGKEADAIRPYKNFDEGIIGYMFDLVPLRTSILTDSDRQPSISPNDNESLTAALIPLMQASLTTLPQSKLRVVHTAASPHEILSLIQHVGIDLFDAQWAQRAADFGVALDFTFPAPHFDAGIASNNAPRLRDGKRDVGHNLYDTVYAHDFAPLASTFRGANSQSNRDQSSSSLPICPCAACSPVSPNFPIRHSIVDSYQREFQNTEDEPVPQPPFTRAYIHHLLHTHEMSSHALLVMHNLTVLDAFLAGIRTILGSASSPADFIAETQRFEEVYDGGLNVFEEAKRHWLEVDLARGKGRLAREKAKLELASLGTTVEL